MKRSNLHNEFSESFWIFFKKVFKKIEWNLVVFLDWFTKSSQDGDFVYKYASVRKLKFVKKARYMRCATQEVPAACIKLNQTKRLEWPSAIVAETYLCKV